MNNNDTNKTFIDQARFYGKGTKSAAELQKEIDTLKNNGIGSRPAMISMFDIFGPDSTGSYAPVGSHISNFKFDGKTIAYRDLVRGISNTLATDYPSAEDIKSLSDYFKFISQSLEEAVDLANLTRENNAVVRENNNAIANVKAALDAQKNHENSLSQQDKAQIEFREYQENQMLQLQADNKELKAAVTKLSK